MERGVRVTPLGQPAVKPGRIGAESEGRLSQGKRACPVCWLCCLVAGITRTGCFGVCGSQGSVWGPGRVMLGPI